MAYKLLTPGPLTTKASVKQAMLFDSCTWDDEYKNKVQLIRKKLLEVANLKDDYTSVLMQGSGTFSVEATLRTLLKNTDKILVISNGAYGDRIYEILQLSNKNSVLLKSIETKAICLDDVENIIKQHNDFTHLVFVHCETTTGILNDLDEIARLSKKYSLKLIVDAMSSFGGIPIDFYKNDITCLVSSANKCLEGVPGFGFVIVKKSEIDKAKGNAKCLSLDLYDQWLQLENDHGKFRFTSPTHVVLAFLKALEEYEQEGGILARYERYQNNQKLLVERMNEIGFKECIAKENQSCIITTFYYYNEKFNFLDFYSYLKVNGYIIYPGKLSNLEVFRIGNIGQIFLDDISELCEIINTYVKENLND